MHLRQLWLRLRQLESPHNQSPFLRGAGLGLLVMSIVIFFLAGLSFRSGFFPPLLQGIVLALLAYPFFKILQWLAGLVHMTVLIMPTFLFSVLVAGWLALDFAKGELRFGLPSEIQPVAWLITILCFVLLFGSGMALLKKSGRPFLHIGLLIAAAAIATTSLLFLFNEGEDPYPITARKGIVPTLAAAGVADPSQPGGHDYTYFTYGSGRDVRREEYGARVRYQSDTVDASRLLPEWKDSKAKWRERFWKFGVKNFPLNGRVWMPQADGPLPIVMIVHGNHGMEEFSDPGYAYLGELLASRGFITISVDENFVNGTWSGDFRGREMPLRGWLLLKHLEQWRKWVNDPNHELYQKADLHNVVLAGHSRGGEAIVIAAAYNHLHHFPDDANEKFNFRFGIQGLIAIAPTDKRYFRRLDLDDINYLTIQGSYDSDEASYFGFRQYQRIHFTDSNFHFKAGLYLHKANHGQFNSVWGKFDGGGPGKYLLNTGAQLDGEQQRQVARLYISAFAESVLHHQTKYLPLFQNQQAARDWLPDVVTLNQYEDSGFHPLADFEEDINLATAPGGGVVLADDLAVWREEALTFRDDDEQRNSAVVLGWNRTDSLKKEPFYQILLDQPLALDSAADLSFLLSPGNAGDLKLKKTDSLFHQLDFSIILMDKDGKQSRAKLTDAKALLPPLKVRFLRLKSLNSGLGKEWEPTFETFMLPVSAFSGEANTQRIMAITFQFDLSEKGIVILDRIGISKLKRINN